MIPTPILLITYILYSKNTISTINIDMPCVDNKSLIYNIKELPETFSVAAGDLLLIETEEGTNIMDFANFIIGLDNTTFGTTITQHSTDIVSLSSDFTSLSSQVNTDMSTIVGSTTKALITLSGQNLYGSKILKSTNITSVEYIDATHVVRFNFDTNLPNTDYLVVPTAAIYNSTNELVQFIEADKNTNYVDLSAINILDGGLAANAITLGFQIQTF